MFIVLRRPDGIIYENSQHVGWSSTLAGALKLIEKDCEYRAVPLKNKEIMVLKHVSNNTFWITSLNGYFTSKSVGYEAAITQDNKMLLSKSQYLSEEDVRSKKGWGNYFFQNLIQAYHVYPCGENGILDYSACDEFNKTMVEEMYRGHYHLVEKDYFSRDFDPIEKLKKLIAEGKVKPTEIKQEPIPELQPIEKVAKIPLDENGLPIDLFKLATLVNPGRITPTDPNEVSGRIV